MPRRPRLVIEYHYQDGDVGAHPAQPEAVALWTGFTPAHPPSHLLIRPATPAGQRLSNQIHHTADLRKALQAMVTAYGTLHDRLSDLIEDGKLTVLKQTLPDDYRWLVDHLAGSANRAMAQAETVLQRANVGLSTPTVRLRT